MKFNLRFYWYLIAYVIGISAGFGTLSLSAQTNLYDRIENYSDRYIQGQQSQVFTSELTPFGWVGNPHTKMLRQVLGSINSQQEQLRNLFRPKLEDPDKNKKMQKATNWSEQDELVQHLNRISAITSTTSRDNQSAEYKISLADYQQVFSQLEAMLSGKKQLSLKDAYYFTEKAYGNIYIEYDEYSNIIKKSAAFIRQWLTQNGFDIKKNDALHYGIQSFMHDTLVISSYRKEQIHKTTHLPFSYDFNDYKGEHDFRNYFVSKTLATGTGQCNSLPVVYLLLAEQLGAKAYLSYAPLHSFIKYPASDGVLHNYEPTTHWNVSDQLYGDDFRISEEAERSGIYLDTLNKKQIVAAQMLDVAYGFLQKTNVMNEEFVNKCIGVAMSYFKDEANIEGWELREGVAGARLGYLMHLHHLESLSDIDRVPEAKRAYEEMMRADEMKKNLGWQEMKSWREAVLSEQERKATIQPKKNNMIKQKRDLFKAKP